MASEVAQGLNERPEDVPDVLEAEVKYLMQKDVYVLTFV